MIAIQRGLGATWRIGHMAAPAFFHIGRIERTAGTPNAGRADSATI